jgi:hypothetical protein
MVYCFYSDSRNPKHGQMNVHQASTNLKKWSGVVLDVALPEADSRPGMPTVVKMGNGNYIMSEHFYHEQHTKSTQISFQLMSSSVGQLQTFPSTTRLPRVPANLAKQKHRGSSLTVDTRPPRHLGLPGPVQEGQEGRLLSMERALEISSSIEIMDKGIGRWSSRTLQRRTVGACRLERIQMRS